MRAGCLSALLLLLAACAGPPVLRYRFPAGEILRYDVAARTRVHTKASEGANPLLAMLLAAVGDVRVDVDATFAQTAGSCDPEGCRVTLRYERSEVRASAGGKGLPMDAAAAAGTSLEMRLGYRGEVEPPRPGAAAGDDPADPVVQALRAFRPRLPDGPVAPGTRWHDTFEAPMHVAGGLALTQRWEVDYELVRFDPSEHGPVAVIAMTQRGELAVEGAPAQGPPGLTLGATGQGRGHGEARLDVDRGLLLEVKGQMELGADLEVGGAGAFLGTPASLRMEAESEMQLGLVE